MDTPTPTSATTTTQISPTTTNIEPQFVPPTSFPSTSVRPSTIPAAGTGLFADEDILANTTVIEYLGEVLTYREATRRSERRYLKMIDINKHIDAADPTKSNTARYCNDVADTSRRNCKFLIDKGRAFIRTFKNVVKDEELFVDYGRGHWLFCEDAHVAEPFLGLRLVPEGVIALQAFAKGEFLCCKSSPLWSNEIGPGFGAAIRKLLDGEDTSSGNCTLRNNPFLKGTVMVVASRAISAGEVLVVADKPPAAVLPAIPPPPQHAGATAYFCQSPRAACSLVTGFGPFQGVLSNPTTRLIENLRPYAQEMGILSLRVLETSMQGVEAGLEANRAVSRAFACLPRLMPTREIWVHFGVWEGQPNFCLEARAYNNADFGAPDERGNRPRAQVIEADTPLDHPRRTSVDVAGLCAELRELGFPVVVNNDPGRFICNYSYYRSLQAIERPHRGNWGHDDSLFVHVPSFAQVPEFRQLEFARELLVRVCSKKWAPARNAVNKVA